MEETDGAERAAKPCGRLVASDGRTLPLRGIALRAETRAGLARVVLEQRFANPYDDPLQVTYSMPLPSDGVVSGYAFRIGERRIVGEIDRREAARDRFEQALIEGKTAALLEQDRSALFTHEIANVPPRAELRCELVVDQKLRWLDEGAWEWRFPMVVAPRFLGEVGRVADAERVAQDVADGPLDTHAELALLIRDALPEGRRPESVSHALRVEAAGGETRVTFADAQERLDRDVVVRWAAASVRPGVALDVARPPAGRAQGDMAYGLLSVLPPLTEARQERWPRDVIVLLDTSGSMAGEPLEQARRVVAALIGTLCDRDQFEVLTFSDRPRRWKGRPVAANASARRDALAWLAGQQAGGATEMLDGILDALAPLRVDAQRQVVLVTDGQIGFEEEVLQAVRKKLPGGSRLHTVGVGSAPNRSLTSAVARAGHGVEVLVGLGEDPERAAARLVARTDAPLVVDLVIDGSALLGHAPERLPDLFARAPALVSLKLRPEGGEIRVRGKMARGVFEERVVVDAAAPGSGSAAVVALYGRERVEDLEMERASSGPVRDLDGAIERLGLDLQIATRLTSWVAVSEEPSVDPTAPVRRERLPQELPHGMSVEGLGLRGGVTTLSMSAMAMTLRGAPLGASFGSMRRVRSFGDVAYSSPGGPPALHGRVVRRKGREITIEFRWDEAFGEWQPAGEADVLFADRVLKAKVEAHTTRPRRLLRGQWVRLTLELSEDPPIGKPERVEIRSGAGRLGIEVK